MAKAAVPCGEADGVDASEATVVGRACGGKAGSRGRKVTLLSHV